MRSHPSACARALIALFAAAVALQASLARADCPDKKVSCVLHEEGVALLLAGKYLDAAGKFASSIAVEPTARSYLGYAQAVEGLGQVALSYDTMVIAQRLSTDELARTGGKDVEANARGERIKYKLAELRGKVGFVWLRVPDGVPPTRVVSVARQGEGDLQNPLQRWTTMAPGRQVLNATLDDGRRIEVATNLSPGAQQIVVIPLVPNAPPAFGPGAPQPPTYEPPLVQPPMYTTLIGGGFTILTPGVGDVGSAIGPSLRFERRIGTAIGFTARTDLVFHSEGTRSDGDTVDATELLILFGIRTTPARSFFFSGSLGATTYWESTKGVTNGKDSAFEPLVGAGLGIRIGSRVNLEGSFVWGFGSVGSIDMPTRLMLAFEIDLVKL